MLLGEHRTPAQAVGNLLHPLLAAPPYTCFMGALLTDIAYWQSANMQWANFSAWLLAAGLFLALFAVIVGIVDYIFDARIRALGVAWPYVAGNVAALVLEIVNSFVHSRDAYTSVVPTGLILSALAVILLLATGWLGWDQAWRHRARAWEVRS